MHIKPFQLERFFAQHEFSSKYLLSSSDCDGFEMKYILSLANKEQSTAWQNLTLGYTESSGLPALRQTIANQYETVKADEVLVLSPGEANFIAMNVLLSQGDHVVCMSPAYQSLIEVARAIGCDISFWKPTIVHDEWYFSPDDLQKLVKKNTKLFILNFPHNPTGFIPNQSDYHHILKIAGNHGVWVFSDEMYRELYRESSFRLPAAVDQYEKSLSLWGMAKTFGMAGTRLGWLVVKDKSLMTEIQEYKDYLTICSSAPSEILSWIALESKSILINENSRKIAVNTDLFAQFCKRNEKLFNYFPPRAGSTTLVGVNIPGTTLAFSEKLVTETGIMTVPSEMFEYQSGFLRIGLGRKSFGEALGRLENYLKNGKV